MVSPILISFSTDALELYGILLINVALISIALRNIYIKRKSFQQNIKRQG